MVAMPNRARLLIGLLLVVGVLVPARPAVAALGYPTDAPFAMWNVPVTDLAAVQRLGVRYVVMATPGTPKVTDYLATAKSLGLKVIVYVADAATTSGVNATSIADKVTLVRSSSAVFAYLSVAEPAQLGLSLSQLRTLYQTFRRYDSTKPVMAMFNRLPEFGSSTNPYDTGVADIVGFDFYPVKTDGYKTSAPKVFPAALAIVNQRTPGVRTWLMVQGHSNLSGGLVAPTPDQLEQQVRDGFTYLAARGIIYHTWRSTWYDTVIADRSDLQARILSIYTRVRAGTF